MQSCVLCPVSYLCLHGRFFFRIAIDPVPVKKAVVGALHEITEVGR